MGIFCVQSARIYRKTAILVVTVEEDFESGGSNELEVEGFPARTVRFRGGRVLFDQDDRLSDRSLLFIELPDFPIADLIGRRLIDHRP